MEVTERGKPWLRFNLAAPRKENLKEFLRSSKFEVQQEGYC
jgi:hypothetical protein